MVHGLPDCSFPSISAAMPLVWAQTGGRYRAAIAALSRKDDCLNMLEPGEAFRHLFDGVDHMTRCANDLQDLEGKTC